VALFPVDDLARAGAEADPVAALVLCAPQRVRHLLVEGRAVVRDGRLVGADEEAVAAEARRLARRIAARDPGWRRGSRGAWLRPGPGGWGPGPVAPTGFEPVSPP
jgi:hypothetical protein